MRIRILAVTGAMAASTLLAAPAMADTTTPTPDPAQVAAPAQVATPAPALAREQLRFRNTCRTGIATLPASVEGQPSSFVPGAARGVYIWHEKAGWRLRVTHPQADNPKLVEVRGRITSTRKLAKVQTIRLEDTQRGEWVSVKRPSRKVMDFRFVNGGFIDGINFTAGCSGKLGFTVWEVTKDATTGTLVRTALPIYVGSAAMQVTATTDPPLAPSPVDVARVVIRRTPVS